MVSLHAFVDDSASDVGDRRLFLAAYINGAASWIEFNHDWRAALNELPSIAYFKMAEAHHLRGQFSGWLAADRDAKVRRLASIIAESRPWSVHCSISRDDYTRIVAPRAPFPLKQPYFSCFWGVIQTAADYHLKLACDLPLNKKSIPPLNFVFDEQGSLGVDASVWYHWLKASQAPEIAALMGDQPIFGDDKKIVAIQAADMLAWHLRRRHERGPDEHLPILDLLLQNGAYRDIPTSMLKQWRRAFRLVPGVSEVQTRRAWFEARTAVRAMVAAGVMPPTTRYRYLLWMSLKAKYLKLRKRWRRLRSRLINQKPS